MTEAVRPARESGPAWLRIRSKRASEPPPDTGRRMAMGTTWGGSPKKFAAGATAALSTSMAPEALNISTATISPMRDGMMPTSEERPLFAPSRKQSKTCTPRMRPTARIRPMTTGTAQAPIICTGGASSRRGRPESG